MPIRQQDSPLEVQNEPTPDWPRPPRRAEFEGMNPFLDAQRGLHVVGYLVRNNIDLRKVATRFIATRKLIKKFEV